LTHSDFALAGGIYGAGLVALATICTLLGIPGFKPFTDLLAQFYGFYGYSVSTSGIAIGAFWGLIEGFTLGFSPASTTFF
jgi:hypothetical protein